MGKLVIKEDKLVENTLSLVEVNDIAEILSNSGYKINVDFNLEGELDFIIKSKKSK